MLLLTRPRPFKDETLESYLLRLGQENTTANYKSFSDDVAYCAELENIISGKYKGSFSELPSVNLYLEKQPRIRRATMLSYLAKMLKLESIDIENLGFHRSNLKSGIGHRLIRINDWLIPRCLLRTEGIPVCIECIKQNNYIKKYWHLLAYRYCHKHNVILIEKCPKCARRLDYRKSESFHRCLCGFDLRTVPTKKNESLKTVFDDIEQKEDKSNFLANKPYQEKLQLLVWFLYRFETKMEESVQDLSLENIIEAEHYFKNWPQSFIDELKERELYAEFYTDKQLSKTPFNKVFGNIILNSRLIKKPSKNEPILIILRGFINNLIKDNPADKIPNSGDLLVSIREIATLKDLTNNEVFKAFEQGRLKPVFHIKPNQSLDLFHCLFSLRQIVNLT